MTVFLYPGSVYVLENLAAQRVKVGMTGIGVNDVADRLADVNDMWMERKVTCQICGGRLVHVMGLVPQHVKNGRDCLGGNMLPIERDIALAALHLERTQAHLNELSGAERGSAVRVINTLAGRIEKYRHYTKPPGEWRFSVSFYTQGVSEVEALAHRKLAGHLDPMAPFGEVFRCSATEATEAVEAALSQLGLLSSARKRTRLADSPRWPQQTYLRGDA